MDGVIVINKEKGMSTYEVMANLREIFDTKKIGHLGTLDPIATGVLVICVKKATKLVQYFKENDRVYDVVMKFGKKTDTGDVTGNVIETGRERVHPKRTEAILQTLLGPQKQIPPMYSASKHKGKKLFEYAREGLKIWREPRDIEIYSFENVIQEQNDTVLKFRIHCSNKTYIRTVCEDIACRVGTVATMTELHRIKAGNFTIEQAVKIQDACDESIISLQELYENEIIIKNGLFKLINGMPLYFNKPNGMYKLYTDNYYSKKFIGLGIVKDRYLYRKIIL